MNKTQIGRHVAGALLALALAACADGNGAGDGGEPRATRAVAGAAVERDVEAPEVFSRADRALWDGRPSLGGVWVAHPDVDDPERVIIRNPQSGKEVVGALFRRERQNPGPAFQVSSDAASALGMLAGSPVDLRVTALRTQEVSVAPPATEATDAAPAAEEDATLAAEAMAAVRATDADDAATQEGAHPATEEEARTAPPQEERRRFWPFGRRSAPTPEVSEAPLGDDPAAAPTPAPPPAAAAAPATAAIDRGFIQLGIFSVEENAQRAVRMAREAGLDARSIAGQSADNRFWRVTVGPAATTAERDRMLARVRELGFTDAYAVAR
ncbi:MAG: SPOR domain-containing protein [Rhodobacteraceae bacterium]|nr:SPOR domain-containing protein [Paracoccaceae bacterium]